VNKRIVLRLKNLREARGLSQQELSRLSGVAYGYISDLENNKCNPSLRTLEKLAMALDVNVTDLIADESQSINHGSLAKRPAKIGTG